jgi:2-dehydro-3-deoxyphosphooctonate aldolase (KDO 8-P synthase)
MQLSSRVGNEESIGNDRPLFLIAGPCVIETESLTLEIAGELAHIAARLGMAFVFKASYDKANRSSSRSFRGPGLEGGLRILDRVRSELGVPVLTDVHENTPIDEVASVVDVLQTPAFLVRQTDFIQRVARAGKPVNIKKGQFMSPPEMNNVVQKCHEVGNDRIWLTERGFTFGYNNLVADMRALSVLRTTGCPVIFDATHAVQETGALGTSSGGKREMVPVLARAAVAAGIAGIFMETHPSPADAVSDRATMWPLGLLEELLVTLVELDRVVKSRRLVEEAISPDAGPS